ncbi:MAG TPA: hypothetical protein VI030_05490 [Propionibacteriaceae bacterium]
MSSLEHANGYEAAGGADGLLRLANAWHARVIADDVVSHAFSHGSIPSTTSGSLPTGRRAIGCFDHALVDVGPAVTTGSDSAARQLRLDDRDHDVLIPPVAEDVPDGLHIPRCRGTDLWTADDPMAASRPLVLPLAYARCPLEGPLTGTARPLG